jgi:hypothetical protein
VKRILILGVAALVLAVLAPSIGTGVSVAQAGTTVTDPTAPVDPNADPNAPDVNTGDESNCSANGAKLGAHASGEDCPVTPPPAATPTPVTPAPVTPAPESTKKKKKKSNGGSGVAGKTEKRKSAGSLPVVQSTTTVADTDTGTIPQGGIQAGGGGTADDGTALALLLGSGALVLTLMAGGLALRRRGFES